MAIGITSEGHYDKGRSEDGMKVLQKQFDKA